MTLRRVYGALGLTYRVTKKVLRSVLVCLVSSDLCRLVTGDLRLPVQSGRSGRC